jgi:cell division initiation protein
VALTPVEIRHIRLRKGLRGYRRREVDALHVEIVDSFEDVWRERADLADKVEALEHDLRRHLELEELLRTTLVSAERSAAEMRDQAQREAANIVSEAHAEARAVMRRAAAERERLEGEVRRLRSFLRSALDTVEEAGAGRREQTAEHVGEVRRLIS